MARGTDGKLHLPLAESPEYANAPDTNYDLALCRWGAGTLVRIADTGLDPSLQSDPSYPRWQEVLRDLAAAPSDEATGLLIGDGVELTSGHRHWSHLFSLFPTALLNPGPGENHSALALRSLDHYAKMNGAGNFNPGIGNGFPRVAISVMSGQAGRPDAAYRNLSNWFTSVTEANGGYGGGSFGVNMGPSTMYQEAGGAPCNESPLGAAFAIQNWLLSSWQFGAPDENGNVDTIRAFPAVPSTWPTASIGAMSAEGGYNVSGLYQNRTTVWLHVTATAAGAARQVELVTDMAPPLVTTPASLSPKLERTEGTGRYVYSFGLEPGQAILLQRTGATPLVDPTVLPVTWPGLDGTRVQNYWGKHKRTAFPPRPTPAPTPPRPPAPPPPPAVKCSPAGGSAPAGYTCFSNMCAFDGARPAGKTGCGHDICHPSAAGRPTSGSALAALCSLVTGENATAVAAARCNAYPGCETVASNPVYTPGHCSSGQGGDDAGGVCFKFFRSGKAGFHPDTGWTLLTKG